MQNKLITLLFFILIFNSFSQDKVTLKKEGNNIKVFLNEELFTEYTNNDQKPFLYPIIGNNGIHLTRHFPMKDNVEGEDKDHPWQTGLYYTHGSVNGIDFWNDKVNKQKEAKIVLDEIAINENPSPNIGKLTAKHSWKNNETTILTDSRELFFSGDAEKRIIDFKITLMASHGDVTFGDNKEGCMAIRMNPKFQLTNNHAKVINSEGISGVDVWGKNAKWITYYNDFNGKTYGITMMDFNKNLRHPTTWHARDYGLLAANPFGLSQFTKNKKNDGTYIIKKGESLTFLYRFVFHYGTPEEAKISKLYQDWLNQENK